MPDEGYTQIDDDGLFVEPQDLSEFLFSARAGWNIEGEKLFNCDVCWTCKHFDVFSKKCSQAALEKYIKDQYKNYTWYRCSFWQDRDKQ